MANEMQELFYQRDLLMTRTSRLLTAYSRRDFTSKFKSKTGKSIRSFKPALKRDRSTGEIWAAGVTARSSTFILSHGVAAGRQVAAHVRRRAGKAYNVRSYTTKGITAGEHFQDAISKVEPDFQKKAIDLYATAAAKSGTLLTTKD